MHNRLTVLVCTKFGGATSKTEIIKRSSSQSKQSFRPLNYEAILDYDFCFILGKSRPKSHQIFWYLFDFFLAKKK